MVEDESAGRPVCESCGYFNLPTEVYSTLEPPMRFCRLCAYSTAGNAARQPSAYPNQQTLAVICFAANAILDQLGAFDQWKRENTLIDAADL